MSSDLETKDEKLAQALLRAQEAEKNIRLVAYRARNVFDAFQGSTNLTMEQGHALISIMEVLRACYLWNEATL